METFLPLRLAPKISSITTDNVKRLASLLHAQTPSDGTFELCIPGVHATRASLQSGELVHGLHRPALCIIAQGAKAVMLGQDVYEYDASRMLVFSVDMPIAAQIQSASPSVPYLGLRLDIDTQRVAELSTMVYPNGLPKVRENYAAYLTQANESILDAVARLIELMADPVEAKLLAPLVMDEIFIRLLRSPLGGRLAQIGYAKSEVHRVAKAVSWIRNNFSQPMKVDELAELAHMSASSLHKHFKSVTAMSPVQYQKVLRLQEARRLMMATGIDVSTASQRVGYISPSQFSREYARFFGSTPTKDISKLRTGSLGDVHFVQ